MSLSILFFPQNLFICLLAALPCRILVPLPGIELEPPAVEAWSPNHWTPRDVPHYPVDSLPPLQHLSPWFMFLMPSFLCGGMYFFFFNFHFIVVRRLNLRPTLSKFYICNIVLLISDARLYCRSLELIPLALNPFPWFAPPFWCLKYLKMFLWYIYI